MNALREGTSSPISTLNNRSAATASSSPLQEGAMLGIHGGVPELDGVHLAEPLEPLWVLRLLPISVLAVLVPLPLGVEVALRLPVLQQVQRRLREVHVAGVDQLRHVAEEEGEQQRADVCAVDVGVGHEYHPVVPGLLQVELLADARADGRDQRLDLVVLQDLVQAGLLDVQDLAADGEDGPGWPGPARSWPSHPRSHPPRCRARSWPGPRAGSRRACPAASRSPGTTCAG